VAQEQHVYEVRPRKDHRGVDLISDALPFGRLWYSGAEAISNAIDYAKFRSRSRDAVIRVYDDAGNAICKIRDASQRVERDFKHRSGRCGRSPSDRRRVPLRERTPPRARA
jgi:hypothetical protein